MFDAWTNTILSLTHSGNRASKAAEVSHSAAKVMVPVNY